jgi:kynurenine formamidase
MAHTTPPARVTLAEFDALFEQVKNWGRWGPDDQLGTLNLITPGRVAAAAALVRSGRRATMGIPINTTAGPDNPSQAVHHLVQGHDIDIGSSGLTFALDYLGIAFHGDCHTHIDALNHVAYKGLVYNGRPATEVVTSRIGNALDIDRVAERGVVGRGVLYDIPRFRGVDWLEPGEAVTRAELEAYEAAMGVRVDEGDIFVFRTGHHARRLALGAWDNGYPPGEGKAGLHVDTVPWMHERGVAAFLPDGDGETIPSNVEGMTHPLHALQIPAMGMCTADSLQLEDVAVAAREEGRLEFLVVGLPLRLAGGTGSPWSPIAIF